MNNLILVSGFTGTGKTCSLLPLKDDNSVMYLNCEANKKTPFPNKFMELNVIDPLQIFEAFDEAEKMSEIKTIVIDTLTYLMDMFESQYVLTAIDTRGAWSDYQQYFKKLMQEYVKKSTKTVIFLAHTLNQYNESELAQHICVPVKGALKNNGVESYFSCVVSTKKMSIDALKEYKNDYLIITPEDELVGFKHVFQTRLTKQTLAERIRSPIGMWNIKETYIDNNLAFLIERLHEYYQE